MYFKTTDPRFARFPFPFPFHPASSLPQVYVDQTDVSERNSSADDATGDANIHDKAINVRENDTIDS